MAWWGEDIEIDAVFFRGSGVEDIARDDEDFASVDRVGSAIVEVEAEYAFGDERDLLVRVGVPGDDAALLENDAGEHRLFAVNKLTGEERIELLVFDIVPTVESGGGHEDDAFPFE